LEQLEKQFPEEFHIEKEVAETEDDETAISEDTDENEDEPISDKPKSKKKTKER
jgi:hypothetical protein